MHYRQGNIHLDFMSRAKFNIGKVLTPPKSKSPWDAMTLGSTGGWASGLQPWGPALTTAAGAILPFTPLAPFTPLVTGAMGAAGMAGGGTGFQGTDKGWSNLGSTALGGLAGYGLGALGSGIGGAIQGGMSGGLGALGSGFQTGTGSYLGTNIIPGIQGTSGTSIGNAIGGLFGGGGTGAAANSANTLGLGQAGGAYGGAGMLGQSAAATGVGSSFGSTAGLSTGVGTGTAGGYGLLGSTGMSSTVGNTALSAASTSPFAPSWMQGTEEAAKNVSWLDNPLVKMGLGLGMAEIGQLATTPETPQLGPIASKWLTPDAVTAAGQMARDLGEDMYLGEYNVSAETQAFMQVMEKDIRKAYKQRKESVDKMGVASNPQWMRSGERLELLRRVDEEEQSEVDKMKADWLHKEKQQWSANQYNFIVESLKLDEQTRQQFLFADVNDVMLQYGVDREQVLDFRTIARDAGMYLFKSALTGGM